MKHPLHNVVIAGVHNTKQARHFEDETSDSLTASAVSGVLADAAMTLDDVDGLIVTSGGASARPRRWNSYDVFPGRGAWLGKSLPGQDGFMEAACAIASGQCTTVLLADALAGVSRDPDSTTDYTRPANEFVASFGLYTAAEFALIAKRHMVLYGTKPEHLAEIAATIRNNGNANPEAINFGKGEITPDDVLASPMIADPYHRLDCCMSSEGGVGVILTTAERARDLDIEPIYVLGGGVELRGPAYSQAPVFDEFAWVGEEMARRAFRMAELTPADIDICEFYDNFSWEIIHQFETFGFCEKGEGGPFVMDGRIRRDGAVPIVTDGGMMSFSHPGVAPQLQRVVAGVQQLRGTSGPLQVGSPRTVVASAIGLMARFMVIFGKERP